MKKNIVILTGAGMSAESGISTFRDANGLWENHDIMEVASIEGWYKNKELVLDFYNKRRAQLKDVEPNNGHLLIAKLEKYHQVNIITQNVDNLHERAGSKNVLHLHGELTSARGEHSPNEHIYWTENIKIGDKNSKGEQLRPNIVWFGEAVPNIDKAIPMIERADVLIIIGTSLQVYPAAGLIHYAPYTSPVYYIDKSPATIYDLPNPLTIWEENASKGMELFFKEIIPS